MRTGYLSGDENSGGTITPTDADALMIDENAGNGSQSGSAEQSWYERYWPWLAIGIVGVTLIIVLASRRRNRR